MEPICVISISSLAILLVAQHLFFRHKILRLQKEVKSYKSLSIKYVGIVKKYVNIINSRLYKNKKLVELADEYYDRVINHLNGTDSSSENFRKILSLNKYITKVTKLLSKGSCKFD